MITLQLFGIALNNINYDELTQNISECLANRKELNITYVNAHTVTEFINNKNNYYSIFHIVHTDGIGIYLALKLLYNHNKIIRTTGSDYYPHFIEKAKKEQWRLFLFGDTINTLKAAVKNNPNLNIVKYIPGFDYNDKEVIENINSVKPEILLIGLGYPLQEEWVYNNKEEINVKIIICVGGGLKVFSRTKVRGPIYFRKMGLEWLIRVLHSPQTYFKRYFFGGPKFIYQIVKLRIRKFFQKRIRL